MTTCVVCAGTTQCNRCIITDLRKRVKELEQQLQKYNTEIPDCLMISPLRLSKINYLFYRSTKPLEFEYKNDLKNALFITLTFDPNKFGIQPLIEERKNYILHSIRRLYKTGLIVSVYGSFEFHKSGMIHSHFIAIKKLYVDEKDIYRELRSMFTDNPHNKCAVTIYPAKFPQAKEYIEKESTDYYSIYEKHNHLDDIIMLERSELKES